MWPYEQLAAQHGRYTIGCAQLYCANQTTYKGGCQWPPFAICNYGEY